MKNCALLIADEISRILAIDRAGELMRSGDESPVLCLPERSERTESPLEAFVSIAGRRGATKLKKKARQFVIRMRAIGFGSDTGEDLCRDSQFLEAHGGDPCSVWRSKPVPERPHAIECSRYADDTTGPCQTTLRSSKSAARAACARIACS